MNRRLLRGTALLLSLSAFACSSGDGGSEPVPGTLDVVLSSPNGDDGAVMFQVVGVVDSVGVPAGMNSWQNDAGSNVLRAIVSGNLASGSTLLTLHVPDVAKSSSYSLQVLQVSSETYAQRPVGGYSLSLQQ